MRSSQEAIQHYHDLLLRPGMAEESWAVLEPALIERRLTFGGRPLCTVLRPLLYTRDEWAYLQSHTKTVLQAFDRLAERMLDDRDLRSQVRLTEEEEFLIGVEHGYRTTIPTARLDAFFARLPDGSRRLNYVEFNGESPASMAYQDVLGDLFEEMPVMKEMAREYDLELLRSRQAALDAILAIYYEWRGNRDKLPDIAIVDWTGVPTSTEFEIFIDYFGRNGINATFCNPDQLEFRNGEMFADGKPVDFIYKRVLITELLKRYGLDHPIVDALKAGAICLMNPFTCKLLHKKASFAVASDERNRHLLTSDEASAVDAHVPWTRVVEERKTLDPNGTAIDLVPWASGNRDDLVLKPNDEYGGAGVLIGWETDQHTWDTALRNALVQPSIVQQRATIAYEDFPSLDLDGNLRFAQRLVDSDPFLFHGRDVIGCLTRLSSVTLLNVTAGGGSIVPVFLADARD